MVTGGWMYVSVDCEVFEECHQEALKRLLGHLKCYLWGSREGRLGPLIVSCHDRHTLIELLTLSLETGLMSFRWPP